MNPELVKYVVSKFGMDEAVVPLMGRCHEVFTTLADDAGMERLMDLAVDVESPGLVMDVGVAYLLNALAWRFTHPRLWPVIWSRVCDTRVGSSLPSSALRKRTRLEHIHRLRLLEDKFAYIDSCSDYTLIAEAVREVVCSIAIRIPEPDVCVRAWKATITCYLIASEVHDMADEVKKNPDGG